MQGPACVCHLSSVLMATSCRGTDEARGGGGGAAPPTCDVCRRSSVNDAVIVLLVMYAGVGRSVAPGVRAGQGEGEREGRELICFCCSCPP